MQSGSTSSGGIFLLSIVNDAKFTVNQKDYHTSLCYAHTGHQMATLLLKKAKCCSKLSVSGQNKLTEMTHYKIKRKLTNLHNFLTFTIRQRSS